VSFVFVCYQLQWVLGSQHDGRLLFSGSL